MVKPIEMENSGTVVIVHPAKVKEMEAKGYKPVGAPVKKVEAKPKPVINKPSDEE